MAYSIVILWRRGGGNIVILLGEAPGNGGTNPTSLPPPPKILTSTEGLQTLDEDQGEDTAVIKDMEMQG